MVHAKKMAVLAAAYNRHAADLRRYFQAHTHDAMLAEDMTHDVFLRMMRVDVISEDTIRSLLFVVASRLLVDAARHKAYVRRYERDTKARAAAWEQPRVAERIDGERLRRREDRCICMMPERRAQVYRLYFHEEKNSKEISQALNINIRTVEGHIYQSRKQMRKFLG